MEINKIYLGDADELIKKIPDKSIDLIITDPPYGINYSTNRRKNKEHDFCSPIANDNDLREVKNIVPELYRVLKNDSAIYMFCSQDKINEVKAYLDSLVWDGVPRLETLLIDYFGVVDNPYTRQIMKIALTAATARAAEAGVKFDYTVILIGRLKKQFIFTLYN